MANPAVADPLHNTAPPSYNTIAPYAPPVTYPPAPYLPAVDTVQLKGVPPGLEYLVQINQLILQQKFSVSQGSGRTFDVLDAAAQRLFQAKQHSQCCGPVYNVRLKDNSNGDILELVEDCGCNCTRQMKVYSRDAALLGYVKLHNNSVVTHLSLLSPTTEVILIIIGPGFETNVFGNASFEVKSKDEQHVVGIMKNESENQFLVSFPLDLEVTVKALLLSACFYLESLIFDKRTEIINRKSSD
uniref:Phospholipid scramblase n=1 Tax=Leptobrachium leishanense TaxID=445787 RepID=A0A8C5QUE3_9ANUR